MDKEKIVIFLIILFALSAALVVFVSPTGLFIEGVVQSAIQNPSFEENIISVVALPTGDTPTSVDQITSGDPSWQIIGLDDLRLDYSNSWTTEGSRSVRLLGLPLVDGEGTLSQVFTMPTNAKSLRSDLNILFEQVDGYGFRFEICLVSTSSEVAGSCVRYPDARHSNPLNLKGEYKTMEVNVPEEFKGKPVTLSLRTIYKRNGYVDVLWDNIRIIE